MLTFAAFVLARAHLCLTLNELQSKGLYLVDFIQTSKMPNIRQKYLSIPSGC